jgi:hypothetical protein
MQSQIPDLKSHILGLSYISSVFDHSDKEFTFFPPRLNLLAGVYADGLVPLELPLELLSDVVPVTVEDPLDKS